jgi:dihydropteroate synthase
MNGAENFGNDIVHVRPLGLLFGRPARLAVAQGLAGILNGGLAGEKAAGAMAFSMAEVIHRCGRTGEISRRLYPWPRLAEKAETDEGLARRLEGLAAPRPALAGGRLDFSRPRVMGIVNVTPDSFSDGGLYASAEQAIAHGRALAAAGADILDIGGESTRPGGSSVEEEEELSRIIPVIERLAGEGHLVSVDTRKPAVMEAAVAAGAAMINDVQALRLGTDAAARAARLGVPVVLMHATRVPVDPEEQPVYEDVRSDVCEWLERRIDAVGAAGVDPENILVDPGIGFGKNCSENLMLTEGLSQFLELGRPVLFGASRKRYIGAVTGVREASARLAGSLAVAMTALRQGAHVIRVHDVEETLQACRMITALARESC